MRRPAPAGTGSRRSGCAARRSPRPDVPAAGTLPIVTDQFATVTVVPNEEIRRSAGGTLGDLLFDKPGITGSSFAPGASSRPIVRGLDIHRVRIQENGIGSNGASDLGEDHGVPIDPLSTSQVEVIRGPATLRYGSQAIGGVVNASNNRIPEALPCPPHRRSRATGLPAKAPPLTACGRLRHVETRGAVTTVDNGLEGAVLLDAGKGNFALHADAYGRRGDDYRIPSYPYLFARRAAVQRQAAEFVATLRRPIGRRLLRVRDGFVGVSVSRFASFYHIPGIEATETNTRIDLNQTKVTEQRRVSSARPVIDAIRFWVGVHRLQAQRARERGRFRRRPADLHQQGAGGPRRGPARAVQPALRHAHHGGRRAGRAPAARPRRAPKSGLFDPNKTNIVAGYMFNEFKFTDTLKMQLSGRIEQTHVKGSMPTCSSIPTADLERDRNFTPKSGASGC